MIQAKEAAKRIGINVGQVKDTINCLDCKIRKAKQKAIAKTNETKSKTTGERLCINISSVRTKTTNKKFWVLIEDQAICMKWSCFVNQKSNQAKPIINLIKEINGMKN